MNRKIILSSLLLVAIMFAGGSVLAAEEGEEGGYGESQIAFYYASAFGMAFAAGLAALAMGNAVRGFCDGVARNPGASDKLQFGLIFTLVLIETLALYVLAVIFVKIV